MRARARLRRASSGVLTLSGQTRPDPSLRSSLMPVLARPSVQEQLLTCFVNLIGFQKYTSTSIMYLHVSCTGYPDIPMHLFTNTSPPSHALARPRPPSPALASPPANSHFPSRRLASPHGPSPRSPCGLAARAVRRRLRSLRAPFLPFHRVAPMDDVQAPPRTFARECS